MRYLSWVNWEHLRDGLARAVGGLWCYISSRDKCPCPLLLSLPGQHAPASRWPRVTGGALVRAERQPGVGGSAQTRKTGDRTFFPRAHTMNQIVSNVPAAVR